MNQMSQWQYEGALTISRSLVQKYGRENVTVVGHSLAGGQANYVGAMLGVRAIGLNAALLGESNLETIRKQGAPEAMWNITNVNVEGEFVSSLSPGKQLGEVITVGGKATGWLDLFYNHLLDNFDLKKPLRYQPASRR
jgi:Uncharacterised protein family (UPF0227)